MSSGEGKTLSFAQTHSITVDKKRGKHFDALEKRGAFSSFFQMKSVNLQKKKEVFSLTPARLKVQRYIKNLSTI